MKMLKKFDATRVRLVRINGSRTKAAKSVIIEYNGEQYYCTNAVWNRISADPTLPVFADKLSEREANAMDAYGWLAVPSRF